ncbi:MAG: hypothetical protein J6V04_02760 [Bacteroidales bacterium]|nr:hypothetical protein [Bacteroidales bacterium]
MRITNITQAIVTLLLTVGILSSCENKQEEITPSAKIEIEQADETSITATLLFADATECYLHILEGISTPASDSEIITNGKPVAPSTTEYTFEELTPSTDYTIYALAKNDNGKYHISSANGKTSEEEAFDGTKLTHLIAAEYRNDNTAAAGNYVLSLGSSAELEWSGDIRVNISLFNEADEDPINAILPNGTYEPSEDFAPFTYDVSSSYVELVNDASEIEYSPIIGTITVERQGPEYTIIIEGTLMTFEQEFKAKYSGQIQFVQTGTSAFVPFEEDQNITFDYGQMRYWGNWYRPMADDSAIELFQGEYDDSGNLVKGYHLTLLNVYMPKYPDYNDSQIPIAEGTYNILPHRNMAYYYSQPYTFDKGAIETIFEEVSFVGSRITYTDPGTNTNLVGIITEGSFNVEKSGDDYSISIDLTTAEGVSITGSYDGRIVVGNFNDNDQSMPAKPWTTLTQDHTYNFPEESHAYFYLAGNQINDELDNWLVMIYGYNNQYPDGYGDMFTTELLVSSNNGTEIPCGTFEIEWKTEGHTMYPGFIDHGGSVLFSYYGDLTPDADGYSSQSAPISSGTVTITKGEDGNYNFVFEMTDDGGNKITGEWSGAASAYDLREDLEQYNTIKNNLRK